ncbi:hypothetical protein A2165_01570 [Candidatus Curtissbacteria bacterium RBG_13_40_7]|uniref:Uncharacterized protein n=1 Tax=Candidatus Curtissbacteria bacterium RBG_13_40_7 TaxID=1797706 RepID=A0A1F5FTJ7_9BACT|nr:MAG: hypothetical protein A2165_01570 [Candidatus Curtissbacteria bacterium RBG_13_40_7]
MKLIKILWRKWLPLAQIIGNFNAQVILTVFYLIIIMPLGVIYRIFADPLRMRLSQAKKRQTNFVKWEHKKETLEEARKQY